MKEENSGDESKDDINDESASLDDSPDDNRTQSKDSIKDDKVTEDMGIKEEPNTKPEIKEESNLTVDEDPITDTSSRTMILPDDVLFLKKVDDEDIIATGRPYLVCNSIPLPKGSTIGPFRGELVSLSSIQQGDLVLQVFMSKILHHIFHFACRLVSILFQKL